MDQAVSQFAAICAQAQEQLASGQAAVSDARPSRQVLARLADGLKADVAKGKSIAPPLPAPPPPL
jgi:hypothetical protein